jgi:hypothetical protein
MPFKDPEAMRQYKKQHYLKNKAKVAKRHEERAEEISSYKKQYRQEHKDELTAYNREYRATHPEHRLKENAYNRQYRKEHRARLREYRKQVYALTGK